MGFRIERARSDEVDALCVIERSALERFRGHRAWPFYAAMAIPPSLLQQAVARGLVWVAHDDVDTVGGFVWLETESARSGVGIAEIDVLPSHGRQGIGAALLEHACNWARSAGYRHVQLATQADLAWNAPFYGRHGFARMAKGDPDFAAVRDRDRANGFPDDLRVFMRRTLPPLAPGEWTAWPAPAKLNLFLRVLGRRMDGYHDLQTVFRLLDWGDEMRLRVRNDGVIQRSGTVVDIAPEDDLALRAARALQAHAGSSLGADIALEKRVPVGGGLGGGSSDAATVLVALNQLWGLHLDEDVLAALGHSLGADVPVFVRGRSAWGEGVGEHLTAMVLPRRHYVVLDPQVRVSTAHLFQAPQLTRNAPATTISSFVSGEASENAFTPVVRKLYPDVATALDWLGQFGQARLSGSGGCVFLETRSYDRAFAIARRCPPEFVAQAVSGVTVSSLQERLARHSAQA